MPIPEIEEFAKILVGQVRDMAIQDCDLLLQPDAMSRRAQRWRNLSADPALKTAIPDAVDVAVSSLLRAIDQGVLQLTYTSESGREIDLTEQGLGELCGWYMGSGGWRAMYSSERLFDDVSDLAGNDAPD